MLFVLGIFLNYYVLPLFYIEIPHLTNHFRVQYLCIIAWIHVMSIKTFVNCVRFI